MSLWLVVPLCALMWLLGLAMGGLSARRGASTENRCQDCGEWFDPEDIEARRYCVSCWELHE